MELCQPIQITSEGQPTNGNCCRNFWLFLSHADKEQRRMTFPTPPTSWPIGVGEGGATRGWGSGVGTWRRGGRRQFYWDTHRRQRWMSRVVPDAWEHWLYKPSRQEKAVSMVHSYRVTVRLLWRSLKQPSVPLAGILYEKRPHTARLRVASETTEEGTFGVWLIGSPRFKLIET